MKKSIKFISIILSVAVILTLALTLVACNKDKYETTTVTEGVDDLLSEISANTATADNFKITRDCKDSQSGVGFDYVVMKVNYGSEIAMAYGTESNFDNDASTNYTRTILLGDYYASNDGDTYFAHDKIAYYQKTSSGWELATEENGFSAGCTKVSELGVYDSTKYVDNYLAKDYSEATLVVEKTTKNGSLESYSVKLTIDAENIVTFKTVDYNGKQCIAELTYTMSKDKANDPTIEKYTISYGVTFDIPVVEE